MTAARQPKPGGRLVADLESQVKFLREALTLLPSEPDRYKQLAAGLRVLVCGFRQNRPLLLDLMDELGCEYLILPYPAPIPPPPLVEDFGRSAKVDLDAMSPEERAAYDEGRTKPYSLRSHINKGLAIYFQGRAYSYADLIRTLAEQSGLGHEDWSIDPNLPEMESFWIGHLQSHIASLASIAQNVIDASVLVVQKAVTLGYTPHYLRRSSQGIYELPSIARVV